MKQRPFKQVDVFTAEAYRGNPLAVVLDGEGLSTEAMQHFTNWTNLSEATFLLPPTDPGADYKVRIFCPGRELPFAGHPTLGSCHAWLQAGGQPKGEHVVQECRRCARAGRCRTGNWTSSLAGWASRAARSSTTPGATTGRTGAA
jgi:PhzF family phenazine biosynthesis protein